MAESIATRLRTEVIDVLKRQFVGRDEVIELIALAVVAGEHLLLHGPPGTAKSALIRRFAGLTSAAYFEYLLTRFSEPNEIFGPIDLVQLREGRVATVTSGMLPEAEFVFLDELFHANSAILNSLLSVLNERVYRRGRETRALPLFSMFSATNQLPEDDALKALFDRFLLRCHVASLPRSDMPALLAAGWALEEPMATKSSISADDLRALERSARRIDLAPILEPYAHVITQIRDLGVGVTDRRAVKGLKLVAASSVLRGRDRADRSDFWVLRYLWDRREQIGPLSSLIAAVLEAGSSPADAHPLADVPERTDADELARELERLGAEIDKRPRSLIEAARLRDAMADLAEKSAWVGDDSARRRLTERTSHYLAKLG